MSWITIWIGWALAAVLLLFALTSGASAQQPAAQCEEQLAVLQKLAQNLAEYRSRADVEIASLRVALEKAQHALDAAKEAKKTEKKEK